MNPFGPTLKLLVGYLMRVKPKVVFAQLEPINLLAGVAGHLANIPKVVLSFRNYNPSRFTYLDVPWFQPFYRALSHSSRVSMSGNSRAGNDDYAQWIGIPSDGICWIPNAIDATDFADPTTADLARLRSELSLQEGQPVILGVFRLSEEKQPELFVRVCALVASRIPRLRVLLVGVGPMRARVQEAIREVGFDATLLGRRDDVMALMKLSSLVLLTSRHEGMPNVLMEAQLAGVPVVATRVGGVADCVNDGITGFLLASDDTEGLVTACARILTDPGLASRMGKEGASYIRNHFTKDRLAALHIGLIKHIDRDLDSSARPAQLLARPAPGFEAGRHGNDKLIHGGEVQIGHGPAAVQTPNGLGG
jgi:glycosyltransferase involved in cell wall biosynthesis